MIVNCQGRDEPSRTFSTHVCSKAGSCNFSKVSECMCAKMNLTSYTEEAIKDVILPLWKTMTSEEKPLALRISCPGHHMRQFFVVESSKEMFQHTTKNLKLYLQSPLFNARKRDTLMWGIISLYQVCNKLHPFKKKQAKNKNDFKYYILSWRS